MKKKYWFLLIFAAVAVITFFTGPEIPEPVYSENLPELPQNLQALENYILEREASMPVRKDNQARIIWQTDPPKVTEYSIVYLHGFAGSYRDGYPVNVQLADTLEANIFLARWAGHGLKPDAALTTFSPEAAWESAKEALVIGNRIGKKVILVSTSTGGTLAFKLAAEYPEKVHALINMSPNIEDDVDLAFLLNSPWGCELAKLVSFGDHRKIEHEQPLAAQYFDTVYPSKALVDLQVLVSTTMNPGLFRRIETPTLTLFYRENFLEEDEHVEVEIYPEVHQLLSTPEELEDLVRLEAPKTHFLGSEIKSKNTEVVLEAILEFLQNNLNINIKKEQSKT